MIQGKKDKSGFAIHVPEHRKSKNLFFYDFESMT
jgi:hypothetical protein